MTNKRWWTLPIAVLLVQGIFGTARLRADESAKYADPVRFEKEIRPSGSRWKLWATMQKANQLIADDCAQDAQLTYVDIATSLLDAGSQVRDELYLGDHLHLNRAGHEILRDTLKPILLKAERPLEEKKEESPVRGKPGSKRGQNEKGR